MPLTNNLKKQVDLPVWEWCRFAPVATSSLSSISYGDANNNRYMYYMTGVNMYRYDTWSDSWQLLSNANSTPATVLATKYSTYGGYRGNCLGATASTITLAGLKDNTLVGYKIRIVTGAGSGQERTITAITPPTIFDAGIITGTTANTLTDTTKKWKINQFVGYQIRIVYGTGSTIIRKVLYNDATTLTVADQNYQQLECWNNTPFVAATPYVVPVTTAGLQAQYYIENSVATIDVAWTVQPDWTSSFMVLSGGIWALSSAGGAPWSTWQFYDILSDTWWNKTALGGHLFAALGTDISIERTGEVGGVYETGTISAATIQSVTTNLNLEAGKYANYQIRITGGTGIGQVKRIVNNTVGPNSIFYVAWDFEIIPDVTSTFSIYSDTKKITLIGNGGSTIFQYNTEEDHWATGPTYSRGYTRNAAIQFAGQEALALTTATRQLTSITVLNPTPTAGGLNYQIGDIVTVTGGSALAQVRVEAINPGGVVTSVSLYSCGNGYTTGSGKATVVVSGTGNNGLTVNITTVGLTGRLTTAMNHNLTLGDAFVLKGATDVNWNNTYTVLGTPAINIVETIITAAADLVAAFTQSTTVVVDSSKNWSINEHAGKILNLATLGTAPTHQLRRIISNTATTLTVATIVAAVNGTSRYVIQSPLCLGRDIQVKLPSRGASGTASGGSATTLIDSTKAWLVNQWLGYKVRIISGTGMFNNVGDISIIGNDATTLTLYNPGFTPDATTEYQIMDVFGVVNGAGAIRTIALAPVAGGTGYAVGDLLAITGGTAMARVLAVNGNIVTALGLAFGGVSGYTVATAATTNLIGSGSGCTVNVTAITAVASTTTLEDNTKNWTVNQWAGKRVRIISGLGASQELAIASNTATILTFAVATAPDATSSYCILSIAPRSTGTSLNWIYGGSDTANRGKYLFSARGGNTNTWDKYNISTELWDYTYTQQPQSELLNTGTMYSYDGGDLIYFQVNILGRIMVYNIYTNTVDACSTIPYAMSTAILGNRMEIIKTNDGLSYLYVMRHTGQEMWRTIIFWN